MQAKFQTQYKHSGWRLSSWNVDFHPMENYFFPPVPHVKFFFYFFYKDKRIHILLYK